ncbi:FAD binding domain-containing protein [Mycolicibacterium baixiangningiae]|uniref:FAD binding domain-containing protein n=1 Tax=Mycolicibacterium baixiangningiae TaxID=2761578 RepID=UPI001868D645|nr:xanthine dehydrogenase family protein subunit M [Mycolicibacterium baixiangningiae]
MYPFTFATAADEQTALDAGRSGSRYIAGGTTLIDLMRETVERPASVVDINALPYRDIDADRYRLRIGALVRMSELAAHPVVRSEYPVIAQALNLSASAQLRNMASIGGNLMQRPRCLYFRDVTSACNRREPGSGCPAIGGRNRTHAILGTSEHCVATHPSDLAVALVALDARVMLRHSAGERSVALTEFFRMPGTSPEREHNLEPGQMIVAVEVPAAPSARRSGYLKVRDRASYEFAITSAAVALDMQGTTIRAARVAAGGVGTVPWRLPAVERALTGRPANPDVLRAAADIAAEGSKPLSENGFKVELLKRTVARQLETIAGAR